VPAAKSLSRDAVAVLVFPKITKAGLVVGGQYGGEPHHRGRDHGFGWVGAGAANNTATVEAAGSADFIDEFLRERQQFAGAQQQQLPGIGRFDALRSAVEQNRSDCTFEILHAARQRRLRNSQCHSGTGEISMFGERQCVTQQAKADVHE